MKHFQTAEWSDFVNHLASDNRRKAPQSHRGTRRNRYIETGVEASYQPPAEGVRIVKAAFALAVWKSKSPETCELMQLEYDSLSQLAPPGTRSATMRVRQMLFRAEPYQIHIQIELQKEQNRLVVTGQLVDLSHPEMVGREVQVMLSDGREDVVYTVTNQFGEFRAELRNSGDLEISFLGREGKPVAILLRGTLDPLSGAKE
jgi:hypothetical protein